jgi:AcrR family transcriptional regulator
MAQARLAKASPPRRPSANARERIDHAAYELFSRHGIRGVGVDTVVARSGVAKMTLYHHYPSKDDLALAFFEQYADKCARGWQEEVERLAKSPAAALLLVFDALEKWYHSPEYYGCPVMKALLEFEGHDHVVHQGAVRYFDGVLDFLRKLAKGAGARNPEALARQWQIIIWGSMIGACAGDRDAAKRAKALGSALLEHEGLRRAARKRRTRKARR